MYVGLDLNLHSTEYVFFSCFGNLVSFLIIIVVGFPTQPLYMSYIGTP